MNTLRSRGLRLLSISAVLLLVSTPCLAQRGYGVDEAGDLFHFELADPSVVTTVGNIGFLPEGIDFRPSSATLYAIDVTNTTTQLYTINIQTAAATPVGPGFDSAANGLTENASYGFDFNPTTLQADDSMRIRLVNTSGRNLRLHSATGQVAATDGDLLIGANSPFVSAAAYINNFANSGGSTMLFDMDSRNNSLYLQNPPNAGSLNLVGPFGATINNVQSGIHFDVYTLPGDTDPSIVGDFGYGVLRRPDTPDMGPTPMGSYLLYDVNLATGQIANGRVVGPAATPADFTGGFSILPIPEPSSVLLVLWATACLTACRRR